MRGIRIVVAGAIAGAKKARDVWKNLDFDGPRPSRTLPGEGMVYQVRYKQLPVFRIDVHPVDPKDWTPIAHFHIAPDMKKHRELPDFIGKCMKRILNGG